jgi:hypothetical protein
MDVWMYAGVLGGFAVMFWLCARTFDHNVPLATLMLLITGFLFGYLL